MALRKVTLFDHQGPALQPVDEEGQAKPCAMGVRWVNPDTFETIRVRGGERTDPKGRALERIRPTLDLSPFFAAEPPPLSDSNSKVEPSA